jgi:hypothetical protein
MVNGVEENSTAENNSTNIITYVMYIKDIQKYTKLYICPKCGYIPSATDQGSYNRDRFEEHIQNCDGKFKR